MTKIFLDGGIPAETKQALELLGGLDGQTTNPSLITKHPLFIACQTGNKKCTVTDGWNYYREIVGEIALLIPDGSISIEVYADAQTTTETMVAKGLEMATWIPQAQIKLPITAAGLAAAKILVARNIKVNMTLCFSQEQAAAVYTATKGAPKGSVYVSPFVGRLDDLGQNGMSLIENIIKMFKEGDGHVEVLVASLRNLDHLFWAFQLGADIITSPLKLLEEWANSGKIMPGSDYVYRRPNLETIAYQKLDLNQPWEAFAITHPLTDKGIEKFALDWNGLFTKT